MDQDSIAEFLRILLFFLIYVFLGVSPFRLSELGWVEDC